MSVIWQPCLGDSVEVKAIGRVAVRAPSNGFDWIDHEREELDRSLTAAAFRFIWLDLEIAVA